MKSYNGSVFRWSRRVALVALATAPVVAGCAEEREGINRVQPNILDKRFFLGEDLQNFGDDPEFRMKGFQIDAQQGVSNSASIGLSTGVDRLRWEVTEKWLFARRSYKEAPGSDSKAQPRVKGADGKWTFPGPANGTIIAAYPILSHFDIRSGYNTGTGELNNVVDENSTDRPWQQQQYMRVDWSKNVAQSTTDGDTSWVFGGRTPPMPINYNVTDPSSEDAPHFEVDKGYFDVTNKFVVPPETDGFPECLIQGFYNGTTTYDCTPGEAKLRMSFERMPEVDDFEAFEESKAQRDVIGNWGNAGNNYERSYGANPRTEWDPQYGFTDAKTKTFYALHNVWEKSHTTQVCESNADTDKDGTADACADVSGNKGSQCDLNVKTCTIPVRDRSVKTVGWWINKEAPESAMPALEELGTTWDRMMSIAVAYRREVECRRTADGDRATCHSNFFESGKQIIPFGAWGTDIPKVLEIDKGRPVTAVCHAVTRAGDPEVCGKEGTVNRLGDVRKNYLIYWPFDSRAPYGGVASIGADPLSGQLVGATATIMGRSATRAAARARDIIQLAAGDVSATEFTDGVQTDRFTERFVQEQVASVGNMTRAKTKAELESDRANISQAGIRQAAMAADLIGTQGGSAIGPVAALQSSLTMSANGAAVLSSKAREADLFKQLGKAEFAQGVGNHGLMQLVGKLKGATFPGAQAALSNFERFAKMNPNELQDVLDRYQAKQSARGFCFNDAALDGLGSTFLTSLVKRMKSDYRDVENCSGLDTASTNAAKELVDCKSNAAAKCEMFETKAAAAATQFNACKAKNAKDRGEKIYDEFLQETIKGIGLHEMGHAIGMRHNFSSSWDAFNYGPQYWQLRTNEGKDTAECKNPGENCMGPRYLDPVSQEEQGLGDESHPGIDFFANTSTMEYTKEYYGDIVGVGTYDQHFAKVLYGRVVETFDQAVISPTDQKNFQGKHLSQAIAEDVVTEPGQAKARVHYTKAARLAKLFDVSRDCRAATAEELKLGKWRLLNKKLCAPPPKNHLAYEDTLSDNLPVYVNGNGVPVAKATRWHGLDYGGGKTDLVRWPYRYGEDYSRGGFMHAKYFDMGADIYEQTMHEARAFRNSYPWTHFRRGNKEWAWWGTAYAALNNFKAVKNTHWHAVFNMANFPNGLDDDDLARPSVEASIEAHKFLQSAVTVVEPGAYWPEQADKGRPNGTVVADQIFDDVSVCTQLTQAQFIPVCQKEAFNLPTVSESRFIQTAFDNDRGGSWDYFHFPKHAGYDDEKNFAIMELFSGGPSVSLPTRANALDNRGLYVSWRTDMPLANDRLLGGLLSSDWETVAPALTEDRSAIEQLPLQFVDPAKVVRPANSVAIFPNIGFLQQTNMAILAMVYSRSGNDVSLINKMRVMLDNDNGTKPEGARRIAFVDPDSGFRYVATRFGTENFVGKTPRKVELGIASRMLEHANDLAKVAYRGTADPVTGEITYTLAAGVPAVANAAAATELRGYVGLLAIMRQLNLILGDGPL
jgi:hypothetical protein